MNNLRKGQKHTSEPLAELQNPVTPTKAAMLVN
jgi:hypothetical protein